MLEFAAAATAAAAADAATAAAAVIRCPGTTQRGMSADIGTDSAATVPDTPPAPANETAAAAFPSQRVAKWGPVPASHAPLASSASPASPVVDSNLAAAVAADDRGRVEVADAPAAASSITTSDSLEITMRRIIAAVGRLPAVPYAGDCVLNDPTTPAGRRLAIGRCVPAATEVAATATAVKCAVGGRIAGAATSIIETIICSVVTGARAAVGSLIHAAAAATVRGTEGGAVACAAGGLGRQPGVRRRAEAEIGPHKDQVALLPAATSAAASTAFSAATASSSSSAAAAVHSAKRRAG
jgi:hypothetical protein